MAPSPVLPVPVARGADESSHQDGVNVHQQHRRRHQGPPPVGPEVITDPVEVMVAGRDAVAGYIVMPALQYMSGAEVSPDVFTSASDVKGRKAAVDIPAGTLITPDLLEPAE